MPPDQPPPSADTYKAFGETRVAEGWRRLFPVFIARTDHGWEVEVWWGRLLLSLTAAASLAWCALTGSACLFLKHKRGFTDVRYTDTLLWFLPSRWASFQTAYGDFLIAKALKEVEQGKLREALFNLTIGTAKSPGNAEGRLLLTQIYTRTLRQPRRAWTILSEGIPYNKDNETYLLAVFGFLGQSQMDDHVMVVARSLLPKQPAITRRNQIIAFAQAQACFYRGNYDQAEDLIRAYELDRSRDGLFLLVRIEWDRGEHDSALAHLRELSARIPQDAELYNQTVFWLRELGRDDEARAASRLRKITDRTNPAPRIDLLHSFRKDGDAAALRDGIEEIFRDFPRDPRALLALADFAANNGDVALARRVYAHCKQDPTGALAWDYPALMVVEALIVAKDYQGALDMSDQLLAANPDWNKRYAAIFSGLRAIAGFGRGDIPGGQLSLSSFIAQPGLRADNLLVVSRRLNEIGVRAEARRVLAQAVKTDPLNQPALTALVRLDLELNRPDDLAAGLVPLLTMRRPDPVLLQAVYDKLGGDLFLFRTDRADLLRKVRAALDAAQPRPPARSPDIARAAPLTAPLPRL
jgi:tetratricopeptide (TPR) repeat protein